MTINFDLKSQRDIMPLVSVVIPNYNGYQYLERCLNSVFSQSYSNIEVVFVDNASVDLSVSYVKEMFPSVQIIQNSRNLGFSGGVNCGIRASKGESIFTLNTDTELEPDCIRFLVNELEESPDVGLCGPKLLFFDGKINSTGMFFSRGGAAWDRGMGEEDTGQYDTIECKEVMGVCAGAAMYRKAMLDEIGLFDEDFFLIFEDYDLSLRAYLTGWKARYVSDARVLHVGGVSMDLVSDLAVYYGERNKVWVPMKNY
ncbi:MAG: glycosyltransferase family 2 protein, partial [Methanospirillum sp.]|uniref:glycosyltransferase family 2 protein n=1 Tax=Methanospirillum sp. TaxID=45200 RepID=UPI00236F5D8D